jgi:hypothetical protein
MQEQGQLPEVMGLLAQQGVMRKALAESSHGVQNLGHSGVGLSKSFDGLCAPFYQ